MQYKIVTGRNVSDLEQQVNELLAAGWELHGGCNIHPPCYAQAVVYNGINKTVRKMGRKIEKLIKVKPGTWS